MSSILFTNIGRYFTSLVFATRVSGFNESVSAAQIDWQLESASLAIIFPPLLSVCFGWYPVIHVSALCG